MSSGAEYTLSRMTGSPAEMAELHRLLLTTFGRGPSPGRFTQVFETAPFGAVNMGFIARAGAETAAFYGVLPVRMSLHGKQVTVAQSANTMTHPAHQGKGLFTRLARSTYDTAAQEGIPLVFGFPNKNSYPGFKQKLNWQEKGMMTWYYQPVKTIPLGKIAHRLRFLLPLYRFWCSLLLTGKKSAATSFDYAPVSGDAFIPRDKQYLAYKQALGATLISVAGADVLLKADGYLRIGEMNLAPGHSLDKALKKLRRIAFWMGATRITVLSSPGSFWEKQLEGKWRSEPNLPLMYVNLLPGGDFEHAYFSHLDYDTF